MPQALGAISLYLSSYMMKISRKRQIPLILGGVIFLTGGIDEFQNQDFLVGVPSLLAGVFNLVAVRSVNSSSRSITVLLHILYAIVAGVMALATVLSGKHYLQYAWAVAALFFVIAAFLTYKVGHKNSTFSTE